MMRDLAAQVTSSLLRFPEVTVDALGEDEVTLDSVLQGRFTVGRSGLAWLACGPQLEVVHSVTAERFSAYCFSGLGEHAPNVLAARDFSWLKRSGLLLGLEEAEGSTLCLYDLGISRVVKAVVIPGRITAIEPIVSYGGASANTQHLHQSLRWFFGVAAVVTDIGHVLLVDLCLDDVSCSQTEMEPSDLEVVNKSPSEIPRLREGVTQQGRHLCLQLSSPTGTGATALHYIPRTNQLAVGFSDGYLQLWNMKSLKREYNSQLEGGRVPVYAFTFQEPENDPRNCCYLWAVQSNQDLEGDVVSLHLLQLAFGERKCLASGKILYEGLEYCEERYSQDLNGTSFPLRAQATNTRLLSCQTIEKFRPHPDRDDSMNEVASPDTSVSIFSWQVKSYGQAKPSTYIGVFDINRWYHAQMPDSLRAGESLRNCPYFAVWSLDAVVEMTAQSPLLDVLVHERSLSRGLPFTCPPPEQFFNPTTYNFDASCLLNSGIVHLTCSGHQKETLSYLKKAGPTLGESISSGYTRCLVSGLLSPRLADVQPSNLSQEEQLEAILSTAVETSSLGLITGCIKQWTGEEQPGSAANLRYILEWAWDKVVRTKQELDGICAPLFDSSCNFTEPQTLQLLQHSQRLLSNLGTIFHCLLSQAQEITQKGLDGLINKNLVSSLIAQYSQVVLWFCRTGLLPEGSDDEDALQISRPFYSYSIISNCYTTRRQELQRLAKDKWNADCLMIDALVSQCGERLADLWRRDEGGTGQYPPLSLHALLDIYLLENIDESAKHAIVIYLLLDVMYSVPNKSGSSLESFPTAFAIPIGLVKLVQGLWLLDHRDHENSLELLLHPATSHSLWAWQHGRVLEALMVQGQHAIALRYLHVMKPSLTSTGDAKLCLSVLLHNRCMVEAWALLRQHSTKLNAEELLRFLYETSQELGLMKELLKLPLGLAEQECLERFLQGTGGVQNRELLMVHYLQQANYIPALQLNHTLKMNMLNDRDPKMKERSNTRNSILEQYGKVLPRAQRRLATERAKPYGHPSSVLKKVSRPQPLSTVAKRSAAENVLTRATFISSVMSKIEEVWVGKDATPDSSPLKSPRVPEILVPSPPARSVTDLPEAFVGTPISVTRRRMSRMLDLMVHPSSSQPAPESPSLPQTPPRVPSVWAAPKSAPRATELNLLQTPQVVKRARALAASMSVMSSFTPQSILRSSLRPTPIATPTVATPTGSHRSASPPLPVRPKESRITFIDAGAVTPDTPKDHQPWSNGLVGDSEVSLSQRSSVQSYEEEEEEDEVDAGLCVSFLPQAKKRDAASASQGSVCSTSSLRDAPPSESSARPPSSQSLLRPSLGGHDTSAASADQSSTMEFHDAPEEILEEEQQQEVEEEEGQPPVPKLLWEEEVDEEVVVRQPHTAPAAAAAVEEKEQEQEAVEELEDTVPEEEVKEEEEAPKVEEEAVPSEHEERVEEEEVTMAQDEAAAEESQPEAEEVTAKAGSVEEEAEEPQEPPVVVVLEDSEEEEETGPGAEADAVAPATQEEEVLPVAAAEMLEVPAESVPPLELFDEEMEEEEAAAPDVSPEEALCVPESVPDVLPEPVAQVESGQEQEAEPQSNHAEESTEEPAPEVEVERATKPQDITDLALDEYVEHQLFDDLPESTQNWAAIISAEGPVESAVPKLSSQKSVASSEPTTTSGCPSVVSVNDSEDLSSAASEEESDAEDEEDEDDEDDDEEEDEEEEGSSSEVEIIEEVQGNGRQHLPPVASHLYMERLPPHAQYLQEQASAVLSLVTPDAQEVEGMMLEEDEDAEVVMLRVGSDGVGGVEEEELLEEEDEGQGVCYTELKPSTTLLVPLELAQEAGLDPGPLLHTQHLLDSRDALAPVSPPTESTATPAGGFSLMLEAEEEGEGEEDRGEADVVVDAGMELPQATQEQEPESTPAETSEQQVDVGEEEDQDTPVEQVEDLDSGEVETEEAADAEVQKLEEEEKEVEEADAAALPADVETEMEAEVEGDTPAPEDKEAAEEVEEEEVEEVKASPEEAEAASDAPVVSPPPAEDALCEMEVAPPQMEEQTKQADAGNQMEEEAAEAAPKTDAPQVQEEGEEDEEEEVPIVYTGRGRSGDRRYHIQAAAVNTTYEMPPVVTRKGSSHSQSAQPATTAALDITYENPPVVTTKGSGHSSKSSQPDVDTMYDMPPVVTGKSSSHNKSVQPAAAAATDEAVDTTYEIPPEVTRKGSSHSSTKSTPQDAAVNDHDAIDEVPPVVTTQGSSHGKSTQPDIAAEDDDLPPVVFRKGSSHRRTTQPAAAADDDDMADEEAPPVVSRKGSSSRKTVTFISPVTHKDEEQKRHQEEVEVPAIDETEEQEDKVPPSTTATATQRRATRSRGQAADVTQPPVTPSRRTRRTEATPQKATTTTPTPRKGGRRTRSSVDLDEEQPEQPSEQSTIVEEPASEQPSDVAAAAAPPMEETTTRSRRSAAPATAAASPSRVTRKSSRGATPGLDGADGTTAAILLTPPRSRRKTRSNTSDEEPAAEEQQQAPKTTSKRSARKKTPDTETITEVPEATARAEEDEQRTQTETRSKVASTTSPSRLTRASSRGVSLSLETAVTPPRSRRKTKASATTAEKAKTPAEAPLASATEETAAPPSGPAVRRLARSRHWKDMEEQQEDVKKVQPMMEAAVELVPGTPLGDALMERLQGGTGGAVTEIIRARRRTTSATTTRSAPAPTPLSPTVEEPSGMMNDDAPPEITLDVDAAEPPEPEPEPAASPGRRRTRSNKGPELEAPTETEAFPSTPSRRTRGRKTEDVVADGVALSPAPVTRTRRAPAPVPDTTQDDNNKDEVETKKTKKSRTTRVKAPVEPRSIAVPLLLSPVPTEEEEPGPARSKRRVAAVPAPAPEPTSTSEPAEDTPTRRANLRRKRMLEGLFTKPVTRRRRM
ncbi:protein ELYS [Engraulis encrasicolus]|uniref:protein ELYS n=1 Tax=Engraulis encrasicolus TaxID=184585 RepID=UPI002FD522C7